MKTIYSLVTKPINQNVSIIRISGPDTFVSLKGFFKPEISTKGNTAEFRKLYNKDGEFVDDVIVLGFRNPNSFTGEDLVEIQSHGNIFVVKKILSMLEGLGFKQATPGEFSKQAYMNNKMDLTQADAINTLINAETEVMANAASKNLNSKQSKNIDDNIKMLSEIISRIQVSIDYPENRDLEEYSDATLNNMMQEMIEKVTSDIKQSETLIKIDEGVKLSIIGIPNAGKSTLLNALIDEEKAIVTEIEGTTRDIVESQILINGVKITLQDTAGMRDSKDKVESIGIEKSKESAREADIVIALIDGSKDIEEQREYIKTIVDREDIIEVINKKDLKDNEGISISAKDKDISELINYLEKYISEEFDLNSITSATLINSAQISSFAKVLDSLIKAQELLKDNTTDVILFELEDAIAELGRMKGIEIDQEYLTNLFSNFCIGK